MATERIPAVFESRDSRFASIGGDAELRILFDDGRWLEGPAYSPQGRFVLFSDIPNDRVLRYDELSGRVDVWAHPAGFTNGRTVDAEGRFVTCEHGNRRVVRTEHDGSTRVLADAFDGRRLNSPNDVVARSDGSVWFTDPSYGILSDYEGHRSEEEIGSRNVYRWHPDAPFTPVVDTLTQPNGLAFSPDESLLYVSDSELRTITVFEVRGARLGDGREFCSADTVFDGLRVDTAGRVWAATEEGIHVYDSDGILLGLLRLPETASNLEFGGPQRNLLYITATSRFYVIRVKVEGARRH
ncbi:SMP-30/gluconolactonase/LRE family protein [Humibacter sp. RRB41]|uniref:SMP-30/gluconolactonase/LRE family protein n=1 Tax=Humibacter sp. RRB41 TaxID=2919946 RepID=UPI001FA9FE9C|nr:SMP-30/gluconolactonase/LRE family protein [Humibacter sp. RRB41]